MRRTRAWIAAVWVGELAATTIVAGCDGSNPPEQSGVQRLAGRDFGNLFFWNAHTPAFTRQTTVPGAGRQDLWVWPNDENTPLLALSQIEWSPPNWSSEIIAGDLLMTGAYADRVYDLQTRTSINLETVAAADVPALSILDWASIRRDGGAVLAHRQSGEVFAGRGSAFAFLPPEYVASGADFMGNDLAVLASAADDVLHRQLIYRLALPSGDLSLLPVPPLYPTFPTCLPFRTPPCDRFRVIGCGADDAVCPETGRAPCAILYLRADATTAVAQPYVFDVATGQETALPGSDPGEFVLSPDRHSAAWTQPVTDAEQAPIYIHDFCSGAAVQCSLPHPQQLAWRGDGGELVVGLADRRVGLVAVPTGTCSLLGGGTIGQYAFSPGGDRLAWVMTDSAGDSQGLLWIGDAAGGGARMVANDVEAFTFSPDGQALFILRASGEQLSLSWLSLAADSSPEQLITDAYNGGALRGNQRMLVIDHWNSQDGSGNLELVDLPSGTRQVLAHAVTDLAGSSSADSAARVLYAVRGRFASGQDGLWETMLPAP